MDLAEIRREQSGQIARLMLCSQHCSRQTDRAVEALTPLRLELRVRVRVCSCAAMNVERQNQLASIGLERHRVQDVQQQTAACQAEKEAAQMTAESWRWQRDGSRLRLELVQLEAQLASARRRSDQLRLIGTLQSTSTAATAVTPASASAQSSSAASAK